jgi:hypothetical protein
VPADSQLLRDSQSLRSFSISAAHFPGLKSGGQEPVEMEERGSEARTPSVAAEIASVDTVAISAATPGRILIECPSLGPLLGSFKIMTGR